MFLSCDLNNCFLSAKKRVIHNIVVITIPLIHAVNPKLFFQRYLLLQSLTLRAKKILVEWKLGREMRRRGRIRRRRRRLRKEDDEKS